MHDHRAVWNEKHTAPATHIQTVPHVFASAVGPYLAPGMKVLELGCGVGVDAAYFASLNVEVTATDVSDVVIKRDQSKYVNLPNLKFEVLDIAQPFTYQAETFDAVYAHLSLHYFDMATTENLFNEIARILKPDCMFYFSVDSINDSSYGAGKQVEPAVFESQGHLHHFFSLDYTTQLVNERFDIAQIDEAAGTYAGQPAMFVRCWAKKRSI
jgi:ubiquinone/menaquinone biosynthesis C-methylase UbiE